MSNLVDRLFEPTRLADILSALVGRRADKADAVNGRLMQLQREVTDADDKLKRLYKLVEDGATEIDDVLKDPLIH
jgi:site-specific DNA recombinase